MNVGCAQSAASVEADSIANTMKLANKHRDNTNVLVVCPCTSFMVDLKSEREDQRTD